MYLFFIFFFVSAQMNNTFSLQQISQTGILDSNLIMRQYKLDMMARFMEMQAINPTLRQPEIAKKNKLFE